ncbi:hypothetical protein CRE_29301 [Caenorhabditis remanei]|uniref:Uncharacterized protein n=1 Tax=Caenorhabditis remanei TaxID=31234 RepID=E3MXZ1_CAERE|nr:hypothetical protein CRE_29301 [Caenorhabditis remanei]
MDKAGVITPHPTPTRMQHLTNVGTNTFSDGNVKADHFCAMIPCPKNESKPTRLSGYYDMRVLSEFATCSPEGRLKIMCVTPENQGLDVARAPSS